MYRLKVTFTENNSSGNGLNPSTSCLCVSCSFWTTIDIWKVPMKWIEYFQQAVYYAC